MKFIANDFLLPEHTKGINYRLGFFLAQLPKSGETVMACRILANTHEGKRMLVFLRRKIDVDTFLRLANDQHFPRMILSGQLFIDSGPAPEIVSRITDELTGRVVCFDENQSPFISLT